MCYPTLAIFISKAGIFTKAEALQLGTTEKIEGFSELESQLNLQSGLLLFAQRDEGKSIGKSRDCIQGEA